MRWVVLLSLILLIGVSVFVTFLVDTIGINNYLLSVAGMFCALVVVLALVLFLLLFVRWLLNRRNRRRTLFGLACAITLIALFYAEEDWRGWHAWNRYKRHWEAKGERFDPASFIPPPVPEDQNFALTPVVASCYEMYFDKAGHAVWPRNTNVVDRLAFELYRQRGQWPSPELKPALGNWQAGVITDLKAWQNYYRAPNEGLNPRFFTNTFPTAPQPQSPAQDVLLALGKYGSTIEELRTASRLPYSRFPLEYDKEDPAAILLPHLAAMKRCSQVLELRAIAELQNGQSDNAFADVRLMLRLTESLSTEPMLISQLVRISLLDLTLQPIWEGLAQHKWSDAQLSELSSELAKLDFVADYRTSMRSEMILFQGGIIGYLRRHPGQLSYLGTGNVSGNGAGEILIRVIPSGWFYQNQLNCARVMLDLYLPAADVTQRTISPQLAHRADQVVMADLQGFKPYHKAEALVQGLGKTAQKFALGQCSVDLARIACALERYRLAHGEFPEALDALVPTFLATLPHDVIGGGSLKYRRVDKERFLLYSVGWNEKDDGGTVALKDDGSLDGANGDWVWQMPAKR